MGRLAKYDIIKERLLNRAEGKALLLPIPTGRSAVSFGNTVVELLGNRGLAIKYKAAGYGEIVVWRIGPDMQGKAVTL